LTPRRVPLNVESENATVTRRPWLAETGARPCIPDTGATRVL
jgi:hypothetical protein